MRPEYERQTWTFIREWFFFKLKSQKAFTLIELMIAVAIVAVLATFSWGEYSEHIRKSRRTEAKLALTNLAGFMERHFAINGRYTQANNSPAPLPFSVVPQGSGAAGDGTPSFYTIAFSTAPAPTQQAYQLIATPVGSQAADRCGALTLDHLGVQGVIVGQGSTVTAADCW